jgi:hypothetical protein
MLPVQLRGPCLPRGMIAHVAIIYAAAVAVVCSVVVFAESAMYEDRVE